MTTTTSEAHGPVDFVLIEFPRDGLTGEVGGALMDLVEHGTVRIFDLMVISKDADGRIEVLEVTDPGSSAGGFAYFADARSGLLGDDDMQEAAAAMEPDTVAALIVYENTWAIPFVAAARNSGGELIASARIPAPEVIAAIEALETTTTA